MTPQVVTSATTRRRRVVKMLKIRKWLHRISCEGFSGECKRRRRRRPDRDSSKDAADIHKTDRTR